jgi:hypothetical protein
VSPAVYATLSPVAFVIPTNPGIEAILPINATRAAITDLRYAYDEDKRTFNIYEIDKALKQLLLGAVDEMYVRSLRHKYIGYSNVSTRALLDHLYAAYADISSTALQDNGTRLKASYDANLPIETIFDQVEKAVEFAVAGDSPYPPVQVVNAAFQLFFQTGLFADDCKAWKRKDAGDKIWPAFKTFFSEAHKEWRQSQATTAGTGYSSSANSVYQQDTVDAIANLATATAHDRSAVASLTTTNSTLVSDCANCHGKLVLALQEITKLTSTVADLRRKISTNPSTPTDDCPIHYCWTHGYRCTHSSWKCEHPAASHERRAKASDIKGGSVTHKPAAATCHVSGALSYRDIVTNNLTSTSIVPALHTRAIVNSECTSHFLGSNSPSSNKVATPNGLSVGLPNGATMRSTHTALLPFPEMSLAARQSTVFPALGNRALLSIGQFCDDGFDVNFTSSDVRISKNDTLISGQRDSRDGLYYIDLASTDAVHSRVPRPISTPSLPTLSIKSAALNAYAMTTKRDLILYLHRAAFSPVVSTWTEAINAGFFTTWPGLTSDLVRKHLPKFLATAKGHLKQSPKNLRSTKVQPAPLISDEPCTRTQPCFLDTIEFTGKVSTDQTGRFPHTSSRGSKYLMVLYAYDSNAILSEPIKSRSESELVRAYTKLHSYLSARGLRPNFQVLDNECPAALKKFMSSNNIKFQLVPPYLHHTNAAEKAIGIYKDHLIAGLSSCDPSFRMHLWDRLLPQATLTLNLLRFSRINPRLSAEAQLNGAFDFNRTPLAPPGTRVLVYENPEKRRTWAAHGVDGWYIGSAPEHYRCYKVYIPKTRAERTAHTVDFFPHNCPVPKTSSADAATEAARALADALSNPVPASPFSHLGDAQLQAIKQLSSIFDNETVHATP